MDINYGKIGYNGYRNAFTALTGQEGLLPAYDDLIFQVKKSWDAAAEEVHAAVMSEHSCSDNVL